MEPELTTEARLLGVKTELIAREPIFHHPELGTDRSAYERMTTENFWEVGASGRRYSRAYVIETLIARHAAPVDDVWKIEDSHCREIATNVYLITYTLIQHGFRRTRRSTLWRRSADGDWRIVYHQGTLIENETAAEPDTDAIGPLEAGMWTHATRADEKWLDRYLHPDFVEVGRSGRRYARSDFFPVDIGPSLEATLPLAGFAIRRTGKRSALTTYDSEVRYGDSVEHAHRVSTWVHAEGRWQLLHHQGTPFQPA